MKAQQSALLHRVVDASTIPKIFMPWPMQVRSPNYLQMGISFDPPFTPLQSFPRRPLQFINGTGQPRQRLVLHHCSITVYRNPHAHLPTTLTNEYKHIKRLVIDADRLCRCVLYIPIQFTLINRKYNATEFPFRWASLSFATRVRAVHGTAASVCGVHDVHISVEFLMLRMCLYWPLQWAQHHHPQPIRRT